MVGGASAGLPMEAQPNWLCVKEASKLAVGHRPCHISVGGSS